MLFNKKYSIFLQLLYFGFALCFHKNIQTNYKFLRKQILRSDCNSGFLRNLYECVVPDISQGEPFSDIAPGFSGETTTENRTMNEPNETNYVPLKLPDLNAQDKMILAGGGMIQKQHRDGYRVSGSVVIDIKCSPNVVFDTLTQIAMYENMIPIVKSSKIISSDGISTVAEFALTSLFIRANVKHTVLPDKRLLKFILDKNQINLVVKEAEGFWHVQVPTDRPEGYCRVYLSARVVTDTIVPPLILDYAVSRALSRATKWMKPFFFVRK